MQLFVSYIYSCRCLDDDNDNDPITKYDNINNNNGIQYDPSCDNDGGIIGDNNVVDNIKLHTFLYCASTSDTNSSHQLIAGPSKNPRVEGEVRKEMRDNNNSNSVNHKYINKHSHPIEHNEHNEHEITECNINNNSKLDHNKDKYYPHDGNNNKSNKEGCSVQYNGKDRYNWHYE